MRGAMIMNMESPHPDKGQSEDIPELQIVPTPEENKFPLPPEMYRKPVDEIIEEEERKGPDQPRNKPTLH